MTDPADDLARRREELEELDRRLLATATDTDADTATDDGEGQNSEGVRTCPPLAAPEGVIVVVSPPRVGELPHRVRTAEPGTTPVFEADVYRLPDTPHVRADGITMRSATDSAESVVLDGDCDVNSLILVNGSGFTAAHLTVTRAVHHPIHVAPPGDETNR